MSDAISSVHVATTQDVTSVEKKRSENKHEESQESVTIVMKQSEWNESSNAINILVEFAKKNSNDLNISNAIFTIYKNVQSLICLEYSFASMVLLQNNKLRRIKPMNLQLRHLIILNMNLIKK